jgi:cyclic pyranopterin monophosphate synthase
MTEDGRPNDHVFGDGSREERRRAARVERAGRPRMRDLSGRPMLLHRAVAEADVAVSQETLSAIVDGTSSAGDILTVAELAGVMAGKRTSDLIPLVHPVALSELVVKATPDRAESAVRVRAETAATSQAGVEMEALTAASVAALAIYDMVRHDDPNVIVRSVRLVSRSAGEDDAWQRPAGPPPAHSGQGAPRGSRVAGRISSGPRVAGRVPPRRPNR